MARTSASREARAAAEDSAVQELGPNDSHLHVQSPAYLYAVHPDTGLDITFVPGEALPAWAAAGLDRAEQVSENPDVRRLP